MGAGRIQGFPLALWQKISRPCSVLCRRRNGSGGELFRVDNALTLEGERIVSDTPVISIPDSLPDITLTGGIVPGN